MMTKPRIALFIVSLSAGGAERVTSNILQHLSEDFDFHLLLLNPAIHYDLPKNTKIYCLDNENLSNQTRLNKVKSLLKMPFLAYKLKKYCDKHKITTVFALLSRPNYISCFLKMIQPNEFRILIGQRTTASSFYNSENVIDRVNRFLIRQLYPKADLVISNSKGIQHDLIQNFGLHNATSVITNPFDLKHIALLKEENAVLNNVCTEGGRLFEKFTFVTVGRHHVVKNFALLLQSFAMLNDPTTQLLIIGDSALSTQNLPKLADQLGIADRVIFMAFQTNPFKYLSKAHTYVLTSDTEGFPNVLIEAMACGLPVISTDCPSGPREILAPKTDYRQTKKLNRIEEAEFGLLVPTNNAQILSEAMAEIRSNTALRHHYIEQNKKRLIDFQLESVLLDFHRILLPPPAAKDL